MKPISRMSSLELDAATRLSFGDLRLALEEVERLRAICRDIIEVIGCEYAAFGKTDEAISKIDDLANEYFKV